MEQNDPCFITIPGLSGVKHAFSTRLNGVSKGTYESLNLGFYTGDTQENVLQNYEILLSRLGIALEDLVLSSQVHKDHIYVVGAEDRGRGVPGGKPPLSAYDGLITNDPSVCLVIFTADCVPLLFYDAKKQAVGAAHAGWRGTALKIGKKIIEQMICRYGCDPADIVAGIGPSNRACCYQVDRPVAERFQDYKQYLKPDGPDHYRLDLQGVNKQILMDVGVPEENIFDSGYCTQCQQDLFYSHRVLGPKRGSMASLIQLKS